MNLCSWFIVHKTGITWSLIKQWQMRIVAVKLTSLDVMVDILKVQYIVFSKPI